jgi:hypothetical protein
MHSATKNNPLNDLQKMGQWSVQDMRAVNPNLVVPLFSFSSSLPSVRGKRMPEDFWMREVLRSMSMFMFL